MHKQTFRDEETVCFWTTCTKFKKTYKREEEKIADLWGYKTHLGSQLVYRGMFTILKIQSMSPPSLEQSDEAFSSVDLQYSHVMQDEKSPLLAWQWAVQGQRPSWSNQLGLIGCSCESAPSSDAQMFWLFYHISGEEKRGDVKEMTSVSDLEQFTSCLGPVVRVQSALGYYPLLSATFTRWKKPAPRMGSNGHLAIFSSLRRYQRYLASQS